MCFWTDCLLELQWICIWTHFFWTHGNDKEDQSFKMNLFLSSFGQKMCSEHFLGTRYKWFGFMAYHTLHYYLGKVTLLLSWNKLSLCFFQPLKFAYLREFLDQQYFFFPPHASIEFIRQFPRACLVFEKQCRFSIQGILSNMVLRTVNLFIYLL